MGNCSTAAVLHFRDGNAKNLTPVFMFLCFCVKRKDFVPFQIGFRSLPAEYENYLPI